MNTILTYISKLKYKSLLLLAAAIWGLGTVLIKGLVEEIPPFWLVGIRFFSAGVIFSILFAPQLIKLIRERKFLDHVLISLLLGTAMIAGYMANSLGLTDTTAAKSSFLTGLYCVIVPFIAWIAMRKRPSIFNMIAAILCVAGIGLVSLAGSKNFTISWGDAITLLSALFLAIQLALTSKYAPGRNMMAITALQFLMGGAMSLGVAAFTEPLPNLSVIADPTCAFSMVYMVLFATCAALLLQNIGLAKVPPASGSLLLSFESVFGVVFSVILLSETLSASVLAGFALIFVAVLVSEWLPTSKIITSANEFKIQHASDRLKAQRSSNRLNGLKAQRALKPPKVSPIHPDLETLQSSIREHMPSPPYMPTARETSDM